MQDSLPRAERLGALLKARRDAVDGGVIYTPRAQAALLAVTPERMPPDVRSASAPYALLLARAVRERLGTTWGIAETGAAGPDGNRHGDAPGHACTAVSGPAERAATVETGDSDRVANMRAFAAALLDLLAGTLEAKGAGTAPRLARTRHSAAADRRLRPSRRHRRPGTCPC